MTKKPVHDRIVASYDEFPEMGTIPMPNAKVLYRAFFTAKVNSVKSKTSSGSSKTTVEKSRKRGKV